MNKVFKALTIVALAATLAVGAFAQAAGPQGSGVQGGTQNGKGKLGKGGLKGNQKLEQEVWAKLNPPLNAEQKTKLAQINQKTLDAVKALKDKVGTGDKQVLKAEVKKVHQERRDAIKALLTPEQQRSYMALMKEAMEKLRKEKGEKPPFKKNG